MRCGLEVVIHTEHDVVVIQVQTESIAAVAITLRAVGLETYETNVSHEADLIVGLQSDTRTQTYLKGRTGILVACKAKTTVDEEVHHASLHKGVTGIRINHEDLSLTRVKVEVAEIASTLLITQSHTNSPLVIQIVTDLRNDFVSRLRIAATELCATETYATTNINLSLHAHCCKSSN